MGYRTTKSKIEAGSNKVKTFDSINATANISYTTFFYHAFRNILLASVPLLAISALVLSSLHSSATGSGTDQIQFSLSVSCTLSSVVDSAHTKEITNGTYHSDVGKTTITTLCNDGNGYSVYAVGYSNNEEGNTKLINAEHPEYSIDTGLATSGLISNWAMKLNNIPDDPSPTPPTIETDYNNVCGIIPPYWTKVASRASGTTDMAEGSSFTTTYAVYASSSQYAGTYQGQVKYMLVHPSYQRPPMRYMQDVADWKDQLSMEESVRAIDTRDGKKYWVTKLKDGNIWMTQNLDFDIEANTTLNSNTTDLNVAYDSTTEQYAEYNNGYTESNGVIYYAPASSATTIDFQNTGPIIGWQNSNTAPYSANKTDDTGTGHESLGNYYNWTTAIASNDSSSLTQDTKSDITKNPKNSICPKGWRLPTISNQSKETINSTNEFARLNYLYNNNSTIDNTLWLNSPLYFTKSGNINASAYEPDTVRSLYWSSTISSQTNSQALIFDDEKIEPITVYGAGKFRGSSIRCIAR